MQRRTAEGARTNAAAAAVGPSHTDRIDILRAGVDASQDASRWRSQCGVAGTGSAPTARVHAERRSEQLERTGSAKKAQQSVKPSASRQPRPCRQRLLSRPVLCARPNLKPRVRMRVQSQVQVQRQPGLGSLGHRTSFKRLCAIRMLERLCTATIANSVASFMKQLA